jgi:heme exporter protein C
MKTIALWTLWLLVSLCIVGAFLWAPLAEGFLGESSRILFFHVPVAWVSFVAFMTAGIASIAYLVRPAERHDRTARCAVELGLVFCVLATVTGAVWARIMWNAWWNWDPRQSSIAVVLLFYAAYLVLRGAMEDPDTERRVAAAYGVLGLVVAPFFFFVLPRIVEFSLHPEPVVNTEQEIGIEQRMLWVLLGTSVGFTALFFWMLSIQRRLRDPGTT